MGIRMVAMEFDVVAKDMNVTMVTGYCLVTKNMFQVLHCYTGLDRIT
jgi:hypothetical protein